MDECAAYFTRHPVAGLGRFNAISPQDTDRVGGKIGALVRREYGDVSDIRAQV